MKKRVKNKKIHRNAEKRMEYHINNLLNSLNHESQALAFRKDADIVLKIHVDEAFKNIFRKKKHWSYDISKISGSALFGGSMQLIHRAYTTENVNFLIVSLTMGIIGFILVIFGVMREFSS